MKMISFSFCALSKYHHRHNWGYFDWAVASNHDKQIAIYESYRLEFDIKYLRAADIDRMSLYVFSPASHPIYIHNNDRL